MIVLRSQTGLTGSGSHRSSYGGFGGGHPHFHRIPVRQQPNLVSSPAHLTYKEGIVMSCILPIDGLCCRTVVGFGKSEVSR